MPLHLSDSHSCIDPSEILYNRFIQFFTIVIGEFIYSSISGAPAGLGIDKATGRAALILLIAASLQLMYMFSSGCVSFVHPLRHSGLYASIWFLLHIPAVAALTLAGDAGAVLITQNTGVAQGVRWFFSAGVGVGTLCIALLATLEAEKDNAILVMRKVSYTSVNMHNNTYNANYTYNADYGFLRHSTASSPDSPVYRWHHCYLLAFDGRRNTNEYKPHRHHCCLTIVSDAPPARFLLHLGWRFRIMTQVQLSSTKQYLAYIGERLSRANRKWGGSVSSRNSWIPSLHIAMSTSQAKKYLKSETFWEDQSTNVRVICLYDA